VAKASGDSEAEAKVSDRLRTLGFHAFTMPAVLLTAYIKPSAGAGAEGDASAKAGEDKVRFDWLVGPLHRFIR
jgi:hypothetical protein